MVRGRPRQFDADKALDEALKVFWRKGYEGASLLELTEAMGINRPSIYAAFGNKENLFKLALQRYTEGPAAYVREALEEPTARRVAERLIYGAIDLLTDPQHPQGCLVVQGALACGDESEPVRDALAARRQATEAAVRRRLARAKKSGDLPKRADPAALAAYLSTVIRGMAVQAAGGTSRKQLRQVAELALQCWPK